MKRLLPILIALFASAVNAKVPADWTEIKPGGRTLCARGGEFSFLVRAGDPEKIVIDFAGGGACWSPMTCNSDQLYSDNVQSAYKLVQQQNGIYDSGNPDNPYAGWTHIMVPYCTGDLHLGSRDMIYQDFDGAPYTIHHRGGVNARAVVDWLRTHYQNPKDISVMGCSAGAYASVVWTAYLAEAYKSARLFQYGDSGAGVSDRMYFPEWGMDATIPNWIPGLNPAFVDWNHMSLAEVYRKTSEFYPKIEFSQFNHERDRVQTFLYVVLGGQASDWSDRMLKSMDSISVRSNFHFFVAPGGRHCSSGQAYFYSTKVNGVSLRDWLSNAIHRKNFENVKCVECSAAVE